MRLPWNSQYTHVSGSETPNDDEYVEKHGFLQVITPPIAAHKGGQRSIICMTVFNLIIFAGSLAILAASRQQYSSMNAVLKASSFYCKFSPLLRNKKWILIDTAPVLDRIELRTSVKQMNATLFPGQNPSIGRQRPNPEADAMWAEIELARPIIITAEDVRKLGKDPANVAKFADDYWHFGDDAYPAHIDVFHQMHCLNSLRKLIYPEYYIRPTHRQELQIVHYNHCVDILFQNLRCNANTDLSTLQWMEGQSHAAPDFNVNHQCRDFDALLEWRKENSVDIEVWRAMRKPKDAVVVPAPKEYDTIDDDDGHLNNSHEGHDGH